MRCKRITTFLIVTGLCVCGTAVPDFPNTSGLHSDQSNVCLMLSNIHYYYYTCLFNSNTKESYCVPVLHLWK